MRQATELQLDPGPRQAESVCLAADEFVIDRNLRGARRGPTLTVGHRRRRCQTELALLDGHRLSVHARGRDERRYVVDLRFVTEEPLTRRTIAWNCWLACLGSATAAALVAWLAWSQRTHPQAWSAWSVMLGLLAAALVLGAVALHRTYETTLLYSVHGHVALARLIGRLGSTREAAPFHAELARHVAAARASIAQSRQAFLRDELREHRRLYEDGVLSSDAYEAGKRRILQAHD